MVDVRGALPRLRPCFRPTEAQQQIVDGSLLATGSPTGLFSRGGVEDAGDVLVDAVSEGVGKLLRVDGRLFRSLVLQTTTSVGIGASPEVFPKPKSDLHTSGTILLVHRNRWVKRLCRRGVGMEQIAVHFFVTSASSVPAAGSKTEEKSARYGGKCRMSAAGTRGNLPALASTLPRARDGSVACRCCRAACDHPAGRFRTAGGVSESLGGVLE